MNYFNLQMFGENDTLTVDDTLTMTYERSDDSLQSIRLPNANRNNGEATIKSAMQFALDNQIFLDSRDGSVIDTDTASILTAYRTQRSTMEYDLT